MSKSISRTMGKAAKITVLVLVAAVVYYQMALAPISVKAVQSASGTVVKEVMGTGTLEARVRVAISPKITGMLTQVLVDQNDRVRKGQLLAKLDERELKQQVEMARADLEAIRAGLARAGADIVRAEATSRLALLEYDRFAGLIKTRAVGQNELDKAVEQRDVAAADLRRAQSSKAELERQIIKAEASIRYYEERLADTSISSPFDGLVLRRSREPGDVVVPGGTILEVASTEQLWISAWVDESEVVSVAPGQPARIVFRSEPGKTYRGIVTRLSPQTDRETREFLVDVTVEELPKSWAIGQRAEVYIETARQEAGVVVPGRVVQWREGQAGVTIDDGGVARWKPITLGLRGSDIVEVRDGLAAGQSVVVPQAGSDGIRDGRAIRVKQP